MQNHKQLSKILVLALAASMLAACHRDPNVRKQQYYAKAMKYYAQGKYQTAAIELRNALKLDPKFSDAHYEMAQCDLKLGYANDAYRQLLNTVDLAPGNWKAQIDIGYMLYAARQFDKAEAKANLVLAADPNNADAESLLANVKAARGERVQAMEEMKKSIALAPSAPKYMDLAMMENAGQDSASAERDYKKAVDLDPKSLAPRLQLAAFYARQRQFDEAKQQANQAIQMDPKSPQAREALIRIELAAGQPAEAEKTAQEAQQALKDNPRGYAILAAYYLQTGQGEKALAEYASLHKEHPKDLALSRTYLDLLIRSNKLDEASQVDAAILKQSGNDVAGVIGKGQIETRQGHTQDAILTLQSALKAEPDNPALHFSLGEAFFAAGNLDLAEREWRETVRERPGAIEAQAALASAELKQKDWDGLATTAQALVKLAPHAALGYCDLGLVQAAHNDLPGAEAQFKRAIEAAPKDALGYTRMGELRMSEKRYREAEPSYEKALAIAPRFNEALRGLATNDLLEKQPAKAVARVRQQIVAVPDDTGDYILLGDLLTGQKDYAGAEDALSKAAGLAKNDSQPLFMLGQVQEAAGKRDAAIAAFRRAIRVNPRDTASLVMLGTLEEAKGDWHSAEDHYRAALAITPENGAAANDLAYLLLQHGGNTDVALSLAQTARRNLPDSPGIADTLGWAYYQKGDYSLAAGLLEEAIKKAPNNPDFNYHLGLIYQKSRNNAQAVVHLERVLKLDPNYAKAGEIRQALVAMGKG